MLSSNLESLQRDKEWIQLFSKDHLGNIINKLEEEKRVIQNKKSMGSITAKKNNQKIGSINYKLNYTKKVKDRVDEFLT